MAKFIKLASGALTEEATGATGGAGDANKVPNLDANGKLVLAMMPDGVGADTIVLPAGEALSANEMVNIYNDAGTIKCRLIDAGTNKYAAHGYVTATVDSGNDATVYLGGSLTGLTINATDVGKRAFASETPGAYTFTPVSGTGKMHQIVGIASSTTVLRFEPEEPITLA